MTATVYRLADYRPDPLSVPCPYCHAQIRRRCTLAPWSPIIRIHGPHPDRKAAAASAAERRQ